MIKKILLPVDGSSFSEKAGEYAINLAKVFNAKLIAVHVIQAGPAQKLESESIEKVKLKQAEACFSSLKKKASDVPLDMETRILVSRSIVDAILEEAKDGDYGIMVIAPRGLGGLKKLVLGSVTEGVLQKSTIPVLVVR